MKRVGVFITTVVLFSSCAFLGQDEVPIPAYIYVPSYTYQTDLDLQGDTSSKFTDVWITQNGLTKGTIGYPALIPIEAAGPTSITLDAGIIRSGQNETRVNYPMIASYVETRNLTPGVVDTLRPTFTYLPGAKFAFIEDFDRSGSSFVINPSIFLQGDTVIKTSDTKSWKPGTFSGRIQIADGHQLLQLIAGGPRDAGNNFEGYLLDPGAPVYLEVDYNSNLPIDIGYYFIDPNSGIASQVKPVVQTFPTNGTWRKIYVDLTDEVSVQRPGTKFIIYLGLFNEQNLQEDVQIDNVKLVYL
ncbi:MAG: hypothetical protein MUE96_01205 [Bacteroidia bacterium]|jgi:hypothetical protein|nr:hypothetical protein [Bacteroidia bacterium]